MNNINNVIDSHKGKLVYVVLLIVLARNHLMSAIGAICTVVACFCFNEWILIPLKKKIN